jgi:hypothetical protein
MRELEAIVSRCLEGVGQGFRRAPQVSLRTFASTSLQLSPGSRPIASTLPSSDSSKALGGASSARTAVSSRQAHATDPAPAGDAAPSNRKRGSPSPFEKSAAPVATSPVPVVVQHRVWWARGRPNDHA